MGLSREERDPDGRIRRARRARGQARDRRGDRSRAHPAPADPDDQLRLHLRRASAGARRPAPAPTAAIAIGTAVVGGMLTATILADLLHPAVLRSRPARRPRRRRRYVRERIAPRAGRRRHEARRRPARAARDRLRDDGAALCPARRRRSRRPGRPATPICARAKRRLPAVTYRDIFRDPRLQALIGQALANNRDLMVAAANIAAAREQYRIQRASQFPQLDADAGGHGHRRSSDDSGQRELSGRARRAELRARPVRPAALADPCPARTLFRDRGGGPRRPG